MDYDNKAEKTLTEISKVSTNKMIVQDAYHDDNKKPTKIAPKKKDDDIKGDDKEKKVMREVKLNIRDATRAQGKNISLVAFLMAGAIMSFVEVGLFLFILGMFTWMKEEDPMSFFEAKRLWFILFLFIVLITGIGGHFTKLLKLKFPLNNIVAFGCIFLYMSMQTLMMGFFTGLVGRESAMAIVAVWGLGHYFILFLVALISHDTWNPMSLVGHLVFWAFTVPCVIGTVFMELETWPLVVSPYDGRW